VHGGQRRCDADDLAWLGVPAAAARDRHADPRHAALRRTAPSGDRTISERRALLEAHRDEVLERIGELQRDLTAVTDKITTNQTMEQDCDHQHPDH
jgi:hypothetical protein